MIIKKTTDYFNKSKDELLIQDGVISEEERLLLQEGLNVTIFNDIEEYKDQKEEYFAWLESNGYEPKEAIQMITGSIALVSK